jgi:hypothetical protein
MTGISTLQVGSVPILELSLTNVEYEDDAEKQL